MHLGLQRDELGVSLRDARVVVGKPRERWVSEWMARGGGSGCGATSGDAAATIAATGAGTTGGSSGATGRCRTAGDSFLGVA